MNELKIVLNKLEKIREKTLNRLEHLTQEQLDSLPTPLKDKRMWSQGEVFMHLAIDEFYLCELIVRPLLEGIKPPEGIRFLPPPPPYGNEKEVIQFWLKRSRLQTKRFFENWPENANLNLMHVGGLRAMNGLGWFEGYAAHEKYHHQQLDRLIKQFS
jgi:hypothetical protein